MTDVGKLMQKSLETLPCSRCEGTKIRVSEGFTTEDGRVYPRTEKPCHACEGRGDFPPVNINAIMAAIVPKQGKNKGSLRATMTAPYRGTVNDARAYYTWRLARFHGGKDMRMPMSADMVCWGDPHRDFLDKLSEQVAKRFFGTDMAAAIRWGQAFGII